MGDYQRAIELYTQSLSIAREFDDHRGESTELCNLGLCHASLGDYQRGIDLLTQALAIARDIG